MDTKTDLSVAVKRRGEDLIFTSEEPLDPNALNAWVERALEAERQRQLDPNTVIAERDGRWQTESLPQWEGDLSTAPLTVVIITSEADAEKYLPACLASLPEWADVVVCRTEPSDEEGVSEPFYVGNVAHIVYGYVGAFDFGRARNVAMSGVTTPWVLHLDADERLLPQQHGKLAKLLEVFPQEVGAGYVTMIGHHIGQTLAEKRYAFPIMRLHRNVPSIYWVFAIHEQLSPSVKDAGYQDADTDLVVLHEGYVADESVMLQKFDRNLKSMIYQYTRTPNQFFMSKICQTVLAAYRMTHNH